MVAGGIRHQQWSEQCGLVLDAEAPLTRLESGSVPLAAQGAKIRWVRVTNRPFSWGPSWRET